MPRLNTLLKRCLIFLHRWLGVAVSAIFALWFASGIVMMYRTFPDVTAEDRLQRAPVLEPARIKRSPEQAFAIPGGEYSPPHVLLTSFDGRPIYYGGAVAVYADDGTEVDSIADAMIDRAAVAWTGLPLRDATKESVREVDQWTVTGALRALRPLYKYSWPDGQQVYVNGRTAEVAQYTTRESRLWAYLGAIPHWLYFTPLRTRQETWFALVVWSSTIGAITSAIGVVIVLWMYSPRKRYRYAGVPTGVPYRGWKRWHAIAGVCFGAGAATWAFSGLLSMGPFPFMDTLSELVVPSAATRPSADSGAADLSAVMRGGRLPFAEYAGRPPGAAIAAVPDFEVKELEFTSFAGEPMYLAFNGRGETRIIPVRGEPSPTFDAEDLMRRMREAAGPHLAELRLLQQYDAYYLDRRRQRPLPVIYARLNDDVSSRFYIDPKTASIVGSYTSREWVMRWLYHGLHSFDFPWLYNYRPLWDIVVITLMLGGTALCVTSLLLTWRVLTRTVAAAWRARVVPTTDDLAA